MNMKHELTQGGRQMGGKSLIRTMHIKRMYDTYLAESGKDLGLTLLEVNIILFLENHKEFNTARDLCNMRMIPKSNASNGIRLLERKGMVRIEYDPDNKKLHRLFLTEKASTASKQLKETQDVFMAELFGMLDPEETEMMDRIFRKMDAIAVESIQRHGADVPDAE